MSDAIDEKRNQAIQLVTKAIESGSIKLLGTSGGANPSASATSDATYLAILINRLTQSFNAKPSE